MVSRTGIATMAAAVVAPMLGGIYAWGGINVEVKDHEQRLMKVEQRYEEAGRDSTAVLQRITAIETKIDAIREILSRDGNLPRVAPSSSGH